MSQGSDQASTAAHQHGASPPSTTATSTQPAPCKANRAPRPKSFLCDYEGCDKAYTRPTRLAEHQRSHTNERPFVCDRQGCDKTFLRDSHLKHHVKSQHENRRDYICDWPGCAKAFVTNTQCRRHRAAHDDKEQIKCTGFPPCEQYFRKQETLQRHIVAVHLQDKPYICDHVDDATGDVCGRRFKKGDHVVSHQRREHNGNRFWCNLCALDTAQPGAAVAQSAAPIEAVGFATFGAMQLHIKTVHPPTCAECGQVCPTQPALRAHIDIQHGSLEARKTFLCDHPDCGRAFTKKGNLQVHIRTVHAKQQRFVCGEYNLSASKKVPNWDGYGACGLAFKHKNGLEGHVLHHHLHLPRSPRRPDVTDGADEVDDRMRDVAQPTRQSVTGRLTGVGYTDERDLSCLQCPHRFMRPYDLQVHLMTAHAFSQAAAVEAAAEEEAVTGGPFWIGGADKDDMFLAQTLHYALQRPEA